jgi:CobQ/CobB/MinD/ParA nucleotide binding domain
VVKKAVKTFPGVENQTDLTPARTTIWVAISEKGGMGKTTVGLAIAELLTAAERRFFLIDADASTPNVGLTYRQEMYRGFRNSNPIVSEVESATVSRKAESSMATKSKGVDFILQEQITFTGNADSYFHADKILDIARTQDVLIVMPSQVASYVNRWLEQNDVVGMLEDPDNTIDIVFFFITNGTPESIDLFVESVESTQGKIPHVLVKNLGAPTNIRWKHGFDEDGKVRAILDKCGFQSIFFPEMEVAPEDKNKILSEYIPFGEAIDSEWIPFSTNRRLKKWLKEATQALGSTGSIPYHPDYIPEVVAAAEVADVETTANLEAAIDVVEAGEAAGRAAELKAGEEIEKPDC